MAVWTLIKNLELDLSKFSDTQVQSLIDNMDSGEIKTLLEELREETEKNENRSSALDLAISIAGLVLSKGIPLI